MNRVSTGPRQQARIASIWAGEPYSSSVPCKAKTGQLTRFASSRMSNASNEGASQEPAQFQNNVSVFSP